MTQRRPPALLVTPMPGRQTVAAGVWVTHGSAHDPAPLAGATHLLEHLTLRRCGAHDRRSLARLVDRLGGDVDAWTGPELMSVSVQTTPEAVGEALELLVEAVLEPTFDPADVDLEQRVALAELELMRDDPAELAEDAILRAAWGDHPLARPVVGSEETLRRLDPSIVCRHHAALVAPGRMVAAVAGEVEPAEVAARLARLPLGRRPAPPPLAPLRWIGGTANVVRPGSEQVHARLAFPAPAAGDQRLTAAGLLTRILGVGASSRLFQRLREEEGLSYDVWSALVARRAGGLLEIGWACSSEAFPEAWRVVHEELGRLAESLGSDELAVAREGLERELRLDADSPGGICGLDVGEVLTRGRRFALERVVAELERVTVTDLLTLARELLAATPPAAAVCGPDGSAEQVA